jgi:uncharacterized protein YcnI
MRRPLRTAGHRAVAVVVRVVAVAWLLAAAPVLLPGTAAADVSVAASRAQAGARNVLITFRVTNADPAVPTTRLQVFLPTVRPLLGVRPTAPIGWTVRVDTAPPTTPAALDGAPVTAIATTVTWDGGTVAGADHAVFPLDVDRLPDGAGPLRFHVVQTFASGATEEWSDLVPYGAPAPAHPALEIPYGSAPGALDGGEPDAASGSAVLPAGAHHHHDDEDVTIPPGGGAVWAFLAVTGAAGTAIVTAAGALGRRQEQRLAALLRDRSDGPSDPVSRRGRRP